MLNLVFLVSSSFIEKMNIATENEPNRTLGTHCISGSAFSPLLILSIMVYVTQVSGDLFESLHMALYIIHCERGDIPYKSGGV